MEYLLPNSLKVKVLILVLVEDGLGEDIKIYWSNSQLWVLILVLVEDGLGAAKRLFNETVSTVLILVLVEDGLGGPVDVAIVAKTAAVLILVLVEDGLGVCRNTSYYKTMEYRLNPCFSGGWSRRPPILSTNQHGPSRS